MQKLMILGSQGMLGMELTYYFQNKYEVFPMASFNLDITNKQQVKAQIEEYKPDILINCAAYTDVERAEAKYERKLAMEINGEAVGNLAKVCSQRGIDFVQISTDYVFDGKKKSAYIEDDLPNPQNIYGKSKLLGEQNVLEWARLNPDWSYYIVRTAWLYGQCGPNFVKKMLHFAKIKKKIKVVEDQIGSPTSTLALTKGIEELIENKKYGKGIYHLVGVGMASWADLTEEIYKIKDIKIPVIRVGSNTFLQTAKRPQFSALQNTKGPKMLSWQEMLKLYLK